MFDLAWSEIALIGVVALVAIGPKDLPIAIKAVAEMVKKGRRMASEFQGHVDEMVREANLHEVRDQINDLRTMDVKGRILSAVDGDGSLRRTINEDPLKPAPVASHQGTTPTALEMDDPTIPAPAPAVSDATPPAAPIPSPETPPSPAVAQVIAQRDHAAEPLPART